MEIKRNERKGEKKIAPNEEMVKKEKEKREFF